MLGSGTAMMLTGLGVGPAGTVQQDLVDADELERPQYELARMLHDEVAAGGRCLGSGADQTSNSGRVEKRHTFEVDDDPAGARLDERREQLAQPSRGGEVDLPDEKHPYFIA